MYGVVLLAVGGGAAGCTLAGRLTEDPGVQVLLLETGPEDVLYPAVDVPALMPLLWNKDTAFMEYTVPQKHACLGFKNNVHMLVNTL